MFKLVSTHDLLLSFQPFNTFECLQYKMVVMKNYFAVVIMILISLGCNEEETLNPENELFGTWRLTEVLADPGDGSGTFQPTTIDKTMTFAAEGTIFTNLALCPFSSNINKSVTGAYTFEDNRGVITPTDCPDYTLDFELSESNLIIYLPCIEPCAEKYEKIRLGD